MSAVGSKSNYGLPREVARDLLTGRELDRRMAVCGTFVSLLGVPLLDSREGQAAAARSGRSGVFLKAA